MDAVGAGLVPGLGGLDTEATMAAGVGAGVAAPGTGFRVSLGDWTVAV